MITPFFWSVDLKSTYKSIWLGWLLITWTTYLCDTWPRPRELMFSWRPEG